MAKVTLTISDLGGHVDMLIDCVPAVKVDRDEKLTPAQHLAFTVVRAIQESLESTAAAVEGLDADGKPVSALGNPNPTN